MNAIGLPLKITRPALRYFGGKWRLAPWLISHFPPHDCYVEPFGGAASVLMLKPRAFAEVYNDLNDRAVNFFRVLRERPSDLVHVLNLTPYSRKEYRLAYEPSGDPLEDARRFAILSGQGNRGAGTIDAGGWRWMKHVSRTATPAREWTKLDHLYQIAARLQGVQIESDDAKVVIARYDSPKTLYYVDPPYMPSTRCLRWGGDAYSCEMREEDHVRLAETLHSVQGMVILSGYPSALYDELYAGWIKRERSNTLRVRSNRGRGRRSIECIWVSPNTPLPQPTLLKES